jgi:hypothetical protein
MDDHIKAKLRRFAEDAEIGTVRSILKWKYKKEGKSIPSDGQLDQESRAAASLAKDVLTKTGKTVWHDLKKVYEEHGPGNAGVKKHGSKKGGSGKGEGEV